MSYVIDYVVTGCTRDATGFACAYKVTFYGGSECTGTITVESVGRAPVTLLKAAGPCAGPALPAPSPSPFPSPPPTVPPAGGGTTSPPVTPPPPTTAPPASGGYKGVGPTAGHWIVTLSTDGSSVTLDDGSKWQIDDSGRPSVMTWLTDDGIVVTAVSGSTYTLSNDAAGTGPVTATYLGGG